MPEIADNPVNLNSLSSEQLGQLHHLVHEVFQVKDKSEVRLAIEVLTAARHWLLTWERREELI